MCRVKKKDGEKDRALLEYYSEIPFDFTKKTSSCLIVYDFLKLGTETVSLRWKIFIHSIRDIPKRRRYNATY